MLFPTLPTDAGPQGRARFDRAVAVAQFFGGQAQTGGSTAETATAPQLPKVAVPSAGAVTPVAKPRKKKKGC